MTVKLFIDIRKIGTDNWKTIGEGDYEPDNEDEQSLYDFITEALAESMMELDKVSELTMFDIKIRFGA